MKTILVLPGGLWQLPLVKTIQQMGFRAAVVSPEENPECKAVADEFLQADIFSLNEIIRFCMEKQVDAVVSDECDIAMPVVAELGDALGLCTISKEMAALYTNKYMMRQLCAENGFPCPSYQLCRTEEEALSFYREIGKPLVIKPLDSNASHGVFTVRNAQDIRDHFCESREFSRVSKAVLAEQMITGTEFTVDGLKTPSQHYTLAISEKKHFAHNENIANELLFTYSNDCFDYDLLRKTNDLLVMKSGLQFGLTHAEYKYEDGRFFLIEIGARGGGNMISSIIVPFLSGQDTYCYLVQCALGMLRDQDFTVPKQFQDRAAVLHFFETPGGGGRVCEVKGKDFLEKEPGILAYQFRFHPGDVIADAKDDSARIGFYIACAENLERLQEIMQQVKNQVQIILS